MTTLVNCPECALPAALRRYGRLASTADPVEHVFVKCVVGHWFLGPAGMLDDESQALLLRPTWPAVAAPD
jgi:hypothetical protein